MRNDQNSKALQYIRDVFANEDEALREVREKLSDGELNMQVGAEEGAILNFLVALSDAKKIVEVGVLAGYSTIWMARALPEGGKIYALEKDAKRIDSIKDNYKLCDVDNKIELVQGDAIEGLKSIEKHAPFDMIFIDADKANYCNYLDWAEKNLKKGGMIIGDNTFLFGNVYGEPKKNMKPAITQTMDDFNKRLGDKNKYTSIMLPTEEGMTVAIKNF